MFLDTEDLYTAVLFILEDLCQVKCKKIERFQSTAFHCFLVAMFIQEPDI